jgi:hypothetical protein
MFCSSADKCCEIWALSTLSVRDYVGSGTTIVVAATTMYKLSYLSFRRPNFFPPLGIRYGHICLCSENARTRDCSKRHVDSARFWRLTDAFVLAATAQVRIVHL